jgi:hypothetical protein
MPAQKSLFYMILGMTIDYYLDSIDLLCCMAEPEIDPLVMTTVELLAR